MNDVCIKEPACFLWICSYLSDKDRVQVGRTHKESLNLLKLLFESQANFKKVEKIRDLHASRLNMFKLFHPDFSDLINEDQKLLDNGNFSLSIASTWREYNIFQITYKYIPHFIDCSMAFEKYEVKRTCREFGVVTNEAALRCAAASINRISESTFKILCKHATNKNQPSTNGNTALHWALKVRNEIFATILLHEGVDCHPANSRGERPLHFAATWDTDNMVEALLKRKVYIHAWDNKGQTALDWAIAKKKDACIKLLSSRSAS